jgi:hypothetical protein
MSRLPAENPALRLTPQEARAVIKAIEEVEKEEAAAQERIAAVDSDPPSDRSQPNA